MSTFQPEVGNIYNVITFDKSKASTQSLYFQDEMESMDADWTDQFVVIEYNSSIVCWFKERDEICTDLMVRMVNRGVPFSYEYKRFEQKHLDRMQ